MPSSLLYQNIYVYNIFGAQKVNVKISLIEREKNIICPWIYLGAVINTLVSIAKEKLK